jgi:hypothetical protein
MGGPEMIFRDVEGPASLANRVCKAVPRYCIRFNSEALGLRMPAVIIVNGGKDQARRGWYVDTLSVLGETRLVGVTHYPDIADELVPYY